MVGNLSYLGPLCVVGGQGVCLLLETLLRQLEHLPGQLEARRVVVVLRLDGRLERYVQ